MRYEIQVQVQAVHGIAVFDENMNKPKVLGQVSCIVAFSRNKVGKKSQPSLPIRRRGENKIGCCTGYCAQFHRNAEKLVLDTKLNHSDNKTFEVSVMLSRGSKQILLGISSLKFISAVLEANIDLPIHLIGSSRAIEIVNLSKTRYHRTFFGKEEVRDSFFQSNPYNINCDGVKCVCFTGGDNDRRYSLNKNAFIRLKCSCLPTAKANLSIFQSLMSEKQSTCASIELPPPIKALDSATMKGDGSVACSHARESGEGLELVCNESVCNKSKVISLASLTSSQRSSIDLNLLDLFTVSKDTPLPTVEEDFNLCSRSGYEDDCIALFDEGTKEDQHLSTLEKSAEGNDTHASDVTNSRERNTWNAWFLSIVGCDNAQVKMQLKREVSNQTYRIPPIISISKSNSIDVSEVTELKTNDLFFSINEQMHDVDNNEIGYAVPLGQAFFPRIPLLINLTKSKSEISELTPFPTLEIDKVKSTNADLNFNIIAEEDEEEHTQHGWDIKSLGTTILGSIMSIVPKKDASSHHSDIKSENQKEAIGCKRNKSDGIGGMVSISLGTATAGSVLGVKVHKPSYHIDTKFEASKDMVGCSPDNSDGKGGTRSISTATVANTPDVNTDTSSHYRPEYLKTNSGCLLNNSDEVGGTRSISTATVASIPKVKIDTSSHHGPEYLRTNSGCLPNNSDEVGGVRSISTATLGSMPEHIRSKCSTENGACLPNSTELKYIEGSRSLPLFQNGDEEDHKRSMTKSFTFSSLDNSFLLKSSG